MATKNKGESPLVGKRIRFKKKRKFVQASRFYSELRK